MSVHGIPQLADAARRLRPGAMCVVCSAWSATTLCGDCRERFADTAARCERCAMPLAASAPLCGACLRDAPPFTRCHCAFGYVFPWDRLIARFKFRGQVELAATLAQRLALALRTQDAALADAIVAVPLSRRRLVERGYNQAWEIARRLGRHMGIVAAPTLLRRTRDGAHQVDLPLPLRRANLRGAFAVDPAQVAWLRDRHVAVVDDVMTSGATLREAAATLLDAGAARVDAWVLARTPPP